MKQILWRGRAENNAILYWYLACVIVWKSISGPRQEMTRRRIKRKPRTNNIPTDALKKENKIRNNKRRWIRKYFFWGPFWFRNQGRKWREQRFYNLAKTKFIPTDTWHIKKITDNRCCISQYIYCHHFDNRAKAGKEERDFKH